MEKPINASNVQLVCPFTWKPTRIGYVEVDGKKFRYSKVAVRDWDKEPKDAIIK
jgi:large subunit ribosomal protein L24